MIIWFVKPQFCTDQTFCSRAAWPAMTNSSLQQSRAAGPDVTDSRIGSKTNRSLEKVGPSARVRPAVMNSWKS